MPVLGTLVRTYACVLRDCIQDSPTKTAEPGHMGPPFCLDSIHALHVCRASIYGGLHLGFDYKTMSLLVALWAESGHMGSPLVSGLRTHVACASIGGSHFRLRLQDPVPAGGHWGAESGHCPRRPPGRRQAGRQCWCRRPGTCVESVRSVSV